MNQRPLDAFHLKWIALITMAIDHTGVIILLPLFGPTHPLYIISRLIGRIAFPLFAFMIVEGMYHSRNSIKYLIRLALMGLFIGVAMTVLLYLGVNVFAGNIFIDLTLGALTIAALRSQTRWLRFFAIIPFLYIALLQQYEFELETQFFFFNAIKADYGIYGFTLIFSFFLAKQLARQDVTLFLKNPLLLEGNGGSSIRSSYFAGMALLITNLLWYTAFLLDTNNLNLRFMGAQSYAILTVFLLFLYSGKKGRSPKWFQAFSYAFYPLHFVVLYLIYELIIMFS